jgi:hypothetical protein
MDRQCHVQIDHATLGHDSYSPKCLIFAALLEHTLEDFIHAERGDDLFRYVLDGRCKEIRIRSVGKKSNHPEESTTFMRGLAPAPQLCQSP